MSSLIFFCYNTDSWSVNDNSTGSHNDNSSSFIVFTLGGTPLIKLTFLIDMSILITIISDVIVLIFPSLVVPYHLKYSIS